jgi:hypothetical protein
MERTCQTCRFSTPLVIEGADGPVSDRSCQRFPPVPIFCTTQDGTTEVDEVRSFWPTVAQDSTCGEYAAPLELVP